MYMALQRIRTHPSVLQALDFIIYTRGGGSWYFRPRWREGWAYFTPIAGMGHLISDPKFKISAPPLLISDKSLNSYCSTPTIVWILFFPLFRTRLVNVSQSIGPAVQSRRGTCRLSLVGIGQGTLVCLEIRKTKIISIFGFEGVYSFISTATCHKSQIHLF